ncbi:hypothetical protein [Laspinema olomoucense]|uniref:hypothetical protein n=1 Tax=Laspinema olomoucense TaxID=3231600 RepID=UPI0021BAE50C|nr:MULTISPECIES: hypothetical protein [unclassified Laspinema]MCT7972149.1 hypothetical protein [Laspinema sp. D3d]MCT7988376.1 hypothetical protein [Laspinema sp. D3a]
MKIPQMPLQYYPFLNQLIELDNKTIEDMVQSLKIVQPTLELEELTKTVASQVSTISQERISEILELLIYLYYLSNKYEFTQEEVINFMGDFLQNSEEFTHVNLNQLERFKHRLATLLESGGFLYPLSKAANVILDNEIIFVRYGFKKPGIWENSGNYAVQNVDPTVPESEKTFLELAYQWRRETRGISSTNKSSMHPAYQQIIGMGKAVIPLLLRELERKSGQWFWALKAISREDPVPPEKRGQTQEMIRYWLEWGKQKGYKW